MNIPEIDKITDKVLLYPVVVYRIEDNEWYKEKFEK